VKRDHPYKEEDVPDFPIIDSHVHLYDVDRLRYSWMSHVPQLAHTTTMKAFDMARQSVNVERLVFVEVDIDPGLHLEEARFVAGLAAKDGRISAIIAHAPVHNGSAVEADLVALKAIPGVRGVRRLIQQEPDPTVILSQDFIDGVCLLAKYDLSFDICIKHYQLAYAIELVKRCSEVSFIFDHIGKPDIRNGLVEPWKSQMRELAKLPNIVCKMSGVVTEADHHTWQREQLRPYIEHTLDVFGFDRVMFGSDWTVATLALDYPTWVEILDDVLNGASVDEKHKFWRNTAIKAYRLS
jgi:L-fuconolactonase